MTIERRVFRGEFRDVEGSKGKQKWATAVAYNVTDEYGTLWVPGVFDEALKERMPTILYGHDWSTLDHVLGRGIDFRQTPADIGPPGVDVLMEFADVPAAKLAMALLDGRATSKGAVLSDVSVGFERREWTKRDALTPEQLALGAQEAMIKAGMDELSLVVRGAVPGAQVRGRRGSVSLDDVIELARKRAAGDLTDAEAQAALDLLAGGEPAAPPTTDVAPTADELAAAAQVTADAEAAADVALDLALGRSRR